MTNDEKKQYEKQLDFLYKNVANEGGELLDPENLYASTEAFIEPDEDYEINYKQEEEKSYIEAKELIHNMASLYFDDNKAIMNNKYVKNKIMNDAKNFGDINFLQKINKRVIIKQVQQIELGEASPRHYEILNMMIREFRETNKQATLTASTMQDFYKAIRVDIGMDTKVNSSELKSNPVEELNSPNNNIITANDVNSKIEELLKTKGINPS